MFTALLDFLFPPRCPGCKDYTESPGQWCPACEEQYLAPKLFMDVDSPIEAVLCLAPYEGAVRELLHRLKFRRDEGALPYLHQLIKQCWEAADESAIGGDAERFHNYLGGDPLFVP